MKPTPHPFSPFHPHWHWLRPGLGLKRWLGLLVVGVSLIVLGGEVVLAQLFQVPSFIVLMNTSLLAALPPLSWGVVLGLIGSGAVLIALRWIKRNLVQPFITPGQPVAQAVLEYRQRGRGPRVVALGGGTGLSTLLRGLKKYTSNITAIVTVADDGGSSGRLRRTLGVLPPGDFRNCIAALADDEALITQLFQYRFSGTHDLGGHSFGNLFITAMAAVAGSFEQALLESSRVLAIRGRVLPSTLSDVTLVGELVDEAEHINQVEGESRITEASGNIVRVFLKPENAPAFPEAISALLHADLIVLGPGSLYTSLIPNLLVRDVAEAIHASRALKVYVCNTATQPGETDGYSVLDHLQAVERHTRPGLFPWVVANDNQRGTLLPRLQWVRVEPDVNGPRQLLLADLADDAHPWRHEASKLARVVLSLLGDPRPLESQLEFLPT